MVERNFPLAPHLNRNDAKNLQAGLRVFRNAYYESQGTGLIVFANFDLDSAYSKDNPSRRGMAKNIFWTAEELYGYFCAIRMALQALVSGLDDAREQHAQKRHGDVSLIQSFMPRISLPRREQAATIEVQDDDSLVLVADLYSQFLDDLDGFNLASLKSCPVCGDFFVLARKDQKACKPSCAHLYRVRKSREGKRKEKYRTSRRFRESKKLKGIRSSKEKDEWQKLYDALSSVEKQNE